jgi:hypothetical protein
MAGKRRSLISVGGPGLNDSAWDDLGTDLSFAAFTNSTTATILPINVIPLATLPPEAVPFGGSIARLLGCQLVFMAAGTSGGLAASTISRLGLAVYRSFGTLTTALTNAGGALTSLAVTGGVNTALPSGQTFTLTTAAGATPQVYTTSAAVLKGAVSVPVNSITPSATYAVGTPLVGIVGNAIAFGWPSTVDGATGTPAFRQNMPVSMPANTAAGNPALNTTGDPYGPYLPVYPSDVPALFAVTDSSTFSVPAGALTTMIL